MKTIKFYARFIDDEQFANAKNECISLRINMSVEVIKRGEYNALVELSGEPEMIDYFIKKYNINAIL